MGKWKQIRVGVTALRGNTMNFNYEVRSRHELQKGIERGGWG